MGVETKTRTIDGHKYVVTALLATPGFKIFNELLRILGPGLGGVIQFEGNAKNILKSEVTIGNFGPAIATLMDRYEDEKIQDIVKQFAELSTVDGKPLKDVFDLHFS